MATDKKKKSGARPEDVKQQVKADSGQEASEKAEDKIPDVAEETAAGETAGAGGETEKPQAEASGAEPEKSGKAEEAKQKKEPEKSAAQKKEEEDLNTRYMRLAADFQNYKRRTEKEKSDIYAYGGEKIAGDMLNVIDNFERALGQAGDAGDSFVEGMRLIFKQFTDALEKHGLKEIEALGTEFDPNFHNAVMTEDTDQFESGMVSAVLQKGYLFNSKVIRPAMVKVAN